MAGGVPVSVPQYEEKDFRLYTQDVMPLITDRSRVMIINSPNNPTGSVLSYNDMVNWLNSRRNVI